MKYTYCERAMWHVMMPSAFQYLSAREPDWDIPALKRKTKQTFRRMVSRTPDIGPLTKNSLRICLTGGMLWLSAYEAAEGRMSEERFAGIVEASMEAPLVQKAFRDKAKTAFTLKAQKKRAADAARLEAANPFYWRQEVVLGRDEEEYTVFYRQCGLCALGRQEGLSHLVPYMCALDVMSVDWMGGALYRTKTLATGGDCCDFYICRKDSKWDVERRGGQ